MSVRVLLAGVIVLLGMAGYIFFGHQNTLGSRPVTAQHPALVQSTGAEVRGNWLPIAPNYAYVPAYTLAGRPVYLDSRLTSLLFFSPSNAASAADVPIVAKEVLAKGNRPRPLVLVAVVRAASVKRAAAEVEAFMAEHKVASIPVVMQQGPPLVSAYPTLVWFSGGKTRVRAGMPTAADVANALAPAASL